MALTRQSTFRQPPPATLEAFDQNSNLWSHGGAESDRCLLIVATNAAAATGTPTAQEAAEDEVSTTIAALSGGNGASTGVVGCSGAQVAG